MNLEEGHYGANLAAEVLSLRDSVQGWQLAGRPGGLPVDVESDRRLTAAVTHLTAAAAALDALTHHREALRRRHVYLRGQVGSHPRTGRIDRCRSRTPGP